MKQTVKDAEHVAAINRMNTNIVNELNNSSKCFFKKMDKPVKEIP